MSQGENGQQSAASDTDAVFHYICNGIRSIYQQKIEALESKYLFHSFHMPPMTDGEIIARPMVMLMGQYSVGKTTFIKHLLGRDFPGSQIGPEPTTDRFMALLHGNEEKTIPGNALALQQHLPFGSLQAHGTAFLSKFEASCLPCPILERITLVDTPGVLSGEKQRIGRNYEFSEVVRWFADRSDRILLLFDAHKLDISDEFKSCIDQLRGARTPLLLSTLIGVAAGHDDKIRVVLNKSDSIDAQQLMRVHGALMWSLGKVLGTPEVVRVYIGSFWDKPCDPKGIKNKDLFEAEKADLINDLKTLPKNSALRKVNEFIKRVRTARTHAMVIGHLQAEMPMMWGKEDKQQEMIDNLADVFNAVRMSNNVSAGDFPNLAEMQAKLRAYNGSFSDFPKTSKSKILRVDEALNVDIPNLIRQVPGMNDQPEAAANANPFDNTSEPLNINEITTDAKARYELEFANLAAGASSVGGGQVAPHFQSLAPEVAREGLSQIWTLADIDKDGALDCEEFCVGRHLVEFVKSMNNNHNELPPTLPLSLLPSSKY